MAQKNSRIFSYIGQNIKKIRQAKNISQSEFAALFQLSRPTVGAYEEGRTEPKIETLIEIARYFSISIDVLLTRELDSKDVFSLGLLNKKLDQAHESKGTERKARTAPFISIHEKVNFLVSHHDKAYMEGLPSLGVPERLNKVDLIVENEGTKLEVDNQGIHHGDFLFCQTDKTLKNTPEQLHVFVTELEVIAGRVGSKTQKSLLVTFDNLLYEPLTIELKSILQSYSVIGVFSTNTSKPSSLESRLKAIEEKLKLM